LAEIIEEERHHPIASISHKSLEENLEILKKETDQDGNPLEVIRIPMPPTTIVKIKPSDGVYGQMKNMRFEDGSVLDGKQDIEIVMAASYCNFLVTNGLVLLPKYYREGKDLLYDKTDREAKEILQKCFPERKIVQIDSELINLGGGGMHCITQQEPLLP